MNDIDIKTIKNEILDKMNKSLDALNKDLSSLRTGRASTSMLNAVKVDYYGNMVPIEQVATLSTIDARTISINVWDKNVVLSVETAIRSANLGLSPVVDGIKIRIAVPAPTEDSRKKLAKQTGEYSEKCKIAIRHIRKEFLDALKELQKSKQISEDELDSQTEIFEKEVKLSIEKVDSIVDKKSKEIMEL